MMPLSLVMLLSAMALAAGVTGSAVAAEREFYIVSVHHDGRTSTKGDATHQPESLPDKPFVTTRGMWVKPQGKDGEWAVRTFVFDPAEVTVQQGDEVRLHFVGVHGMSHTIVVEGVGKPVVVKRGTEQVVSFKAERPGIIAFTCIDHPPSMRGQVVVLPKG